MGNNKGNALFLILIAVALFALLSYAITSSSRGGGNITKEQTMLNVQQLISYTNQVRQAHMRVRLVNGVAADDVDFTEGGTGAEALFAPEGGGATWIDPPDFAYDGAGAFVWGFDSPSGNWAALGVGTTTPDSIIWIENVADDICRAINVHMDNGDSIPADPNSDRVMDAFSGAHVFCYNFAGSNQFIYVLEAH